ncbi:MAG TPA: signal recognition particle-docking protein FtsY [Firmicutes bacterium]|nr:signal recognition particle-docking protein FtsY [Bacillota bacterium]
MSLLDAFYRGLARTRQSIARVFQSGAAMPEELYDQLFEALLAADTGLGTAEALLDGVKRELGRKTSPGIEEIRASIEKQIIMMMQGQTDLNIGRGPISVILFVGVNGTGKTTTVGKLAAKLGREGHRVMLAAADTFRAAAAEQLEIWARRARADVVTHRVGSDPAAVVFDAISAAKARAQDIVLVDTAGRVQTRFNLMEELKKIHKVISRELPGEPSESLIVLDATTGQNALEQARQFKQAVGLTGAAITKMDGTAKGGIAIAIWRELGVPVKLIGMGEHLDDLYQFDPSAFAKALLDTA